MKLIQTNFQYQIENEYGRISTHMGAYLGRKPAQRNTLQRFMRKNRKDCGLTARQYRIVGITILGSCQSQWVAK